MNDVWKNYGNQEPISQNGGTEKLLIDGAFVVDLLQNVEPWFWIVTR
ncbi:hypothetical protein JK208_09995 [Gluconobacter sp. Dm-74]|uniref:Uncharacterized protein n=1 Tax=Gluconobacter cadivus TaxID=2728101 RepID=A0ABR9YXG5_9PROT|nr:MULTISPECIES: hypothetical protein [Gluconobacter]MBF0888799.1 hypothetical protein [Gluconobacter cadivus]MBS1059847.1 hypothetical protein [Gluconobacter sp. Dm-44]MBS1091943.1 hypothetical protein [Gluconobacter sp. Dm-74]